MADRNPNLPESFYAVSLIDRLKIIAALRPGTMPEELPEWMRSISDNWNYAHAIAETCREAAELTATAAAASQRAEDAAKSEAEKSERMLEAHIRSFVERWSDRYDLYARDQFQHELMMLLIGCMRHQGNTLAWGIEMHAAPRFRELAMRPVIVGCHPPKGSSS
jgi:BMFP domain-containing protein YqiC